MALATTFALLLVATATVKGLDPYQLYAEGSCSRFRAQPARNLNPQALEEMTYINAGSRYQFYRIASSHPRYASMTENELISGFCYRRNTTLLRDNTSTSAIGFGRVLSSFDVHISRGEDNESSGLLLELVPRDTFPSWDTMQQTITLTDNRNFAVALNCWTGSNQVGWHVITRSPNLDGRTRRIVEEHVRQLGFDGGNMIVLRYNRCEDVGLELGRGRSSGRRRLPPPQRIGRNRNSVGSEEGQILRSSQRLDSTRQQGQTQQPSLRQGSRGQEEVRQGRDYSNDIEGLGQRRELRRSDVFEQGGRSNLRGAPSNNDFEDRGRGNFGSERVSDRDSQGNGGSEGVGWGKP